MEDKNDIVKYLHLFIVNQLGFRRSKMTQKPFCRRDPGKGKAEVHMNMRMKQCRLKSHKRPSVCMQ